MRDAGAVVRGKGWATWRFWLYGMATPRPTAAEDSQTRRRARLTRRFYTLFKSRHVNIKIINIINTPPKNTKRAAAERRAPTTLRPLLTIIIVERNLKLLTPVCSWIAAIGPLWTGSACFRSVSWARPGPSLKAHWGPWLRRRRRRRRYRRPRAPPRYMYIYIRI